MGLSVLPLFLRVFIKVHLREEKEKSPNGISKSVTKLGYQL